MTDANTYQVGGTHYKSSYEHWDLVLVTGMGYFEGNATKYIARWRKKDGSKDLKKALHYVNKLLENVRAVYLQRPPVSYQWAVQEVDLFAATNKLSADERQLILTLATWRDPGEVREVRDGLLGLLGVNAGEPEIPEALPVPAEDSNKYADRAPRVPHPIGDVHET